MLKALMDKSSANEEDKEEKEDARRAARKARKTSEPFARNLTYHLTKSTTFPLAAFSPWVCVPLEDHGPVSPDSDSLGRIL
jgi:hypothetical protein